MTPLLKKECKQFSLAPGRVPVYPSRSKPAAPVQFEPNRLCGYERGENMANMYVGENGYISNSNILPSTFIAFYISLASLCDISFHPQRG